jgi:two-component system chemotaxis response regulator CheY
MEFIMTKVLIVDDAAFMRMQLKRILVRHEFDVVGEADNGLSALEMIGRLKPDVITLDITMPEMNGIECLEEINKLVDIPNVIMISAMGQQSFVIEAIEKGAKGFIVKPFKEIDVMSQLNKLKDDYCHF